MMRPRVSGGWDFGLGHDETLGVGGWDFDLGHSFLKELLFAHLRNVFVWI